MQNIRTPRSFRPSSEFLIETTSIEGYIIDAGGSDITVEMQKMNTLPPMSITAASLQNGAITDYTVVFDSFVYLKDTDRILMKTPSTVGFSVAGISCEPIRPDPIGVIEVSCETIDDE